VSVLVNELLLSRLLLSLNFRRVANIIKTSASFFFSALLKKNIVWGVPPVLTIEPTNLCNLRCPLCSTGSGEMERKRGKMTLSTFKTIMDKLGDDIFFLLIYHQGEPYINPNLFEFVRMAKTKNIYVTTSTNGHYFTEENIEKTISCGLDSIIVSIDGITQQSYEKYRVGGKLEIVIDGIKNLIAARKHHKSVTPNVALQVLVMKHNELEIPQMRNLARELGVDRFLVKNIEVHSLAEANMWLPSNKTFRRYDYDGEKLVVKGSQKNSCPRPWTSTLINWDGAIVPCCFDKNGHYTMGNITEVNGIDDIWRGDTFNKFRKKLLENRDDIDICRNCNQGFGSFLPQKRIKKILNKK
jgi:radical SAM protein with 4Fe4S-binding SPASM domain